MCWKNWKKMWAFKADKKGSFQMAFLAGVFEALYILFIIWLIGWLNSYLTSLGAVQTTWMPMLMLMLMVLSVAVSALLVFGYPVYLVVTRKDLSLAIKSLLVTILSLIVIVVVAIATLSAIFF